MADEQLVRLSVTTNKGFQVETISSGSISMDMANPGRGGSIQSIGFAAEEVIGFGDVATEGNLYMKNLDPDNFIEWGPESGGSMVPCGKILPGEIAWYRMKPGVILRGQADTGNCLLDVRLYEA